MLLLIPKSQDSYGATAPVYPESHYQALIAQLNSVFAGKGYGGATVSIAGKQVYHSPKTNWILFSKASIAECRKRTLKHYSILRTEILNWSL